MYILGIEHTSLHARPGCKYTALTTKLLNWLNSVANVQTAKHVFLWSTNSLLSLKCSIGFLTSYFSFWGEIVPILNTLGALSKTFASKGQCMTGGCEILLSDMIRRGGPGFSSTYWSLNDPQSKQHIHIEVAFRGNQPVSTLTWPN